MRRERVKPWEKSLSNFELSKERALQHIGGYVCSLWVWGNGVWFGITKETSVMMMMMMVMMNEVDDDDDDEEEDVDDDGIMMV